MSEATFLAKIRKSVLAVQNPSRGISHNSWWTIAILHGITPLWTEFIRNRDPSAGFAHTGFCAESNRTYLDLVSQAGMLMIYIPTFDKLNEIQLRITSLKDSAFLTDVISFFKEVHLAISLLQDDSEYLCVNSNFVQELSIVLPEILRELYACIIAENHCRSVN